MEMSLGVKFDMGTKLYEFDISHSENSTKEGKGSLRGKQGQQGLFRGVAGKEGVWPSPVRGGLSAGAPSCGC